MASSKAVATAIPTAAGKNFRHRQVLTGGLAISVWSREGGVAFAFAATGSRSEFLIKMPTGIGVFAGSLAGQACSGSVTDGRGTERDPDLTFAHGVAGAGLEGWLD